MKKLNILFVIHRLDAGGAEKSLVSLLKAMPLNQLNVEKMSLLMLSLAGFLQKSSSLEMM